eukprot:6100214-Prorocentrum_lima.AAC.1
MTSSLVGSEMCIRDRSMLGPIHMTPHGKSWQVPWKTKKDVTKERESASAVSYTHLTLPTICSV